ncbi:type II and III secretion system protein [Terriglobus albidus]|uniref:type II and III secretion system protein n=1 Tax=Terriglobus albidus TaxID=1592106 RepID=UPI0021DF7E20|nr:type II and III secretion system protein [Terriglobus albidus]
MIRRLKRCTLFLAAVLTLCCAASAQEAAAKDTAPAGPATRHLLKFVVKELEGGKVINSREYSTYLAGGPKETAGTSSIRTGSKVPIPFSYETAKPATTQITYIDVGVNIDIRGDRVEDGKLYCFIKAEFTSIDSSANAENSVFPRVVRQNSWSSPIFAPLGKPITLFSSDDVASKRTMQLELTATEVK